MTEPHHGLDKKHKKLAQILKNRRTQLINQAEDEHARSRDLEKEREEKIRKSQLASSRAAAQRKSTNPEPVWSAKLQQIRDRNTGRTRDATDRWNRFAGTADGGGRGL